MNKNRLGLHLAAILAIAFFAFLAISSASKPFVYDDTLPAEQTAKIWFLYFMPKSYNGMDLPDKIYQGTFPAGEAAFNGDINWYSQGYKVTYRYSEKDVSFSYKLEGGQEYTFAVYRENDIWGIGIFREIKTFVGNVPPEDRLIVFIPFHTPSSGRIILE